MKKFVFLMFVLLFSMDISAQDKDEHREQIKALKTAYITKGLSLSPKVAERFWPIYNEYEKNRRQLFKKEHRDIGDLGCISEGKAEEMLQEYVDLEKQDYLLQKKFFADLKSIFTAKQIIQLKKVEDEFNRNLIREYRERHAKKEQS